MKTFLESNPAAVCLGRRECDSSTGNTSGHALVLGTGLKITNLFSYRIPLQTVHDVHNSICYFCVCKFDPLCGFFATNTEVRRTEFFEQVDF